MTQLENKVKVKLDREVHYGDEISYFRVLNQECHFMSYIIMYQKRVCHTDAFHDFDLFD